jgi:glycosyltransferase involved in cell wall biosynthesis
LQKQEVFLPIGRIVVQQVIFFVSPSGAVGGGMGRFKDYVLASDGDADGRFRFEVLVTRDEGGVLRSLLLMVRAILRIWAAAFADEIAFVHVNVGDKGSVIRKGLIILASRLAGAKTLLHLHAGGLIPYYSRSPLWLQFLLRTPFRLTTHTVVLGKVWRDWLVSEVGVAPASIDVLYNGVPVDPVPRDFSSTAQPIRTLLFLGQLKELKGIGDFIEALGLISADAPAWRAIVAGNGDIPHYQGLAAARGVGDRVEFTGWVDQSRVRELLAEADMLVLPSHHEGLPLVILEALGSGTPVICTPVGAIPEVLEDQKDALFVEPRDPAGLSKAIAALLADPQRLQALSDRGLERFPGLFSLDVFLANLFQIYRKRMGADMAPARQYGQRRFARGTEAHV